MNKRILISLSVIGAVAAIAVGGTIAYFSDVETSTGNTFTAGELDLRFQVGGGVNWTDVNGAPLFDGVTFPLADLKPGDSGEKTVRLWVDDNPSCGKVSVNLTEDKDNSCTEPELLDDLECSDPAINGDLNDAVNFAVWEDPNCNNILDGAGQGTAAYCSGDSKCDDLDETNCKLDTTVYCQWNISCTGSEECALITDLAKCVITVVTPDDPICTWNPAVPGDPAETILTTGTITEDKSYGIGELPISMATAQCYGIAYCFGTWNLTNGTCNGAGVNNASQSDSFKANIIIDALQKRNQYDAGAGYPKGCPVGDWL